MAAAAYAGLWDRPILVAPMGGGPSTPTLVAAAAEAGAFGFLAAAYKTADQVAAEIAEVRRRTSRPFGVNVFVPGAPTRDPGALAAYLRELQPEAERLGVPLGAPTWDDDGWTDKIEVLVDAAPAMCSFAFACPPPDVVRALQDRGVTVAVTVTSADEAVAAADIGADMLVAQGVEAGAHRGTFGDDDAHDARLPLAELIAAIHGRTALPILAAGGIADPAAVVAALDTGAVAVQVGTAFLRCDESGANEVLKAALVDPAYISTELTRAFTGRRARGLRNRFMSEHPSAPAAYPEIHHATSPLRKAAVAAGDPGTVNLWAGTGHALARAASAASIIDWLATDLA